MGQVGGQFLAAVNEECLFAESTNCSRSGPVLF
jgi:hypothetical protein